MKLAHPVTVLFLGMLVTAPSLGGGNTPEEGLAEARAELQAIAGLAREVRDPAVREELKTRARHAYDEIDAVERGLRFAQEEASRGLSYDDAISIVQREPFDSGKVEAIQRLARTARFSTEEARGIASQCTFESSKIDALVALYPAVTDPQRFELALDVLTWSSSRTEVMQRLGW